jgi:hypothetical protein
MTDSHQLPPPVDFSALDPTRDEGALDARVRAIMADAVIRPHHDLSTQLSGWLMPTLVAASILIAVGSIALVKKGGERRPGSMVESLGIPRGVIELARSESSPGVVQLSEALGLERSYVR